MSMRFRLGFLGAWALFVIGAGLAGLVVAAQLASWQEAARLARLVRIDRAIALRMGAKVEKLRDLAGEQGERLEELRSAVANATIRLDDSRDSEQTIIVSTTENRLFVRRSGRTVFEAVCSTGKGTTMVVNGRTMVFDTPTGSFRIQSKEENPVWVPPDWHFIEEARKKNLGVVRLNAGQAIDADTGDPVPEERPHGVWSWVSARPQGRVLKIRQNTVVEVSPDGSERELPPGELIKAGKAIVVPPSGTRQRRFEKVLGHYRLNIGSGYGIHGTLATRQLGRSASHGCVRLSDADIEKLYGMARVGDRVIIY
ncbi:MAG TPA: L,D-transpeptidase family protein [Thermoanaerobaculia bacterium]|nr:L,D-transpeptidase family protein [Thermoanaerobaculia bacterium]